MKPVKIQIRRKTRVPTKYGTNGRLWRSDWKTCGKIDYKDSIAIFKILRGSISNDAQFAKLLYDNFGEGEYSLICWRYNHKGVGRFMKIELDKYGYKRLPKNISVEEKEKREVAKELKKLNKDLKETGDKVYIQNQIEDLKNSYDDINDIIKMDRTRDVCSEYIKSVLPVYKFHSYESYSKKDSSTEVEVEEYW